MNLINDTFFEFSTFDITEKKGIAIKYVFILFDENFQINF